MKLTPKDIYAKKAKGERIASLSLYDHPTARIADAAGADLLMTGDSLAMVLFGHPNTLSIDLETMLRHTSAVSKAVTRALVVADMPFGSYDDPDAALRNALRFIKEAGADAVKLEGGENIQPQVQKLIAAGIPVMGHVGMLPQGVGDGHYRVFGRTPEEAAAVMRDAKMLDRLGVFAIVLECVPVKLATEITEAVKCPTIGIGAGAGTDGQVLVLHDMLGIQSGVSPRFVRRYAKLEETIGKAVRHYCRDVVKKKFPSSKESFS
ncbi:MAG TPA: 3-methyl-2-oxobutanoate hydroxymethyltransferase [Candidatus Omnitrophota bacterium]|nr:3-methyl-2-oxobutanoate hydroxymethyltransferase [Candidatus Omnitrophota bacterium]HPS36940.1 3-methyl-2-oxobutanoate hydroxymethyltransferase [Candidatus Omnitrophota bacterium]